MKMMKDVTQEYEHMRAQLLLIRVSLGLNPCQDPVWAVSTLFAEGRDAFEQRRGEKCEHAHEWTPLRS